MFGHYTADARELWLSSEQRDYFLNLPNMIGQPGLHGRCNAKRLADPAAVVVHEVKGNVVGSIQLAAISFFGGTAPHSGQRSGVARRS
jgi:hypothetical protein